MASAQSSQDMWRDRDDQLPLLEGLRPRKRSESRHISDRRPVKTSSDKLDHCPAILHEGDAVQVFSRSADAWMYAEAVEFVGANLVRVEYKAGEHWCSKMVDLYSEHLITPFAIDGLSSSSPSASESSTISEQDPGAFMMSWPSQSKRTADSMWEKAEDVARDRIKAYLGRGVLHKLDEVCSMGHRVSFGASMDFPIHFLGFVFDFSKVPRLSHMDFWTVLDHSSNLIWQIDTHVNDAPRTSLLAQVGTQVRMDSVSISAMMDMMKRHGILSYTAIMSCTSYEVSFAFDISTLPQDCITRHAKMSFGHRTWSAPGSDEAQEFSSVFGNHFVERIMLGGVLEVTVEKQTGPCNDDVFNVKDGAGLSIQHGMKYGAEEFKVTMKHRGGLANCLPSGTGENMKLLALEQAVAKWSKSVAAAPDVVHVKLAHYSRLPAFDGYVPKLAEMGWNLEDIND